MSVIKLIKEFISENPNASISEICNCVNASDIAKYKNNFKPNWITLTELLPLDYILRNSLLPPENNSWCLYTLTERFDAEFIMNHPNGPFDYSLSRWDEDVICSRDDISFEFKKQLAYKRLTAKQRKTFQLPQ